MTQFKSGDRVVFGLPDVVQTGTVIAIDNTGYLVRSDFVVAVHDRQAPETGQWKEHQLYKLSGTQMDLLQDNL